ncbi:AAA family ATPase [Streptomyces sp. NPDC006879]|uniref:helix-turn-helix transcriptional regulator n=1 Tax=Streptomyces sp. NPDC006879 TaxID=3364767 RepID=UPI0036BEC850
MRADEAEPVGRAEETAVLDRLLAALPGTGGSLVLSGGPGIGKTALLRHALHRAARRGIRTKEVAGIQPEPPLPYAGLRRLLAPVLPEAQTLPEAQRNCLSGALGMTASSVRTDRLKVAMAALALLCDRAHARPLLVVVEDAHWLDASSAQAISFLARRLRPVPVLMLIARRDGQPDNDFDDTGLERLPLTPLPGGAAGRLLDAQPAMAALRVTRPNLAIMRQRLLREAAGVPLALVELPLAPVGPDLVGEERPPLSDRLEQTFAHRYGRLPASSRSLLLAAALNDGDRLAEALGAAQRLAEPDQEPVTLEAVEVATTAGLVESSCGRLLFRHPLMRSAVRKSAGPTARQAAHQALAEQLATQPDRALWHHACGSQPPDPDIAASLESAARRAGARGDCSAAVETLLLASAFSDDPGRRGELLLRAADAAVGAGRFPRARRLLTEAGRLPLRPVDRAQLAWFLEVLGTGPWSDQDRVAQTVGAVERMRASGREECALEYLHAAAQRCWWTGLDDGLRKQVAESAGRFQLPHEDARLLSALACAAPVHTAREVRARLSQVTELSAETLPDLTNYALAACALGDFRESHRFLQVAVRMPADSGGTSARVEMLTAHAVTLLQLGRHQEALAAAETAVKESEQAGLVHHTAMAHLIAARASAALGDGARCASEVALGEEPLLALGAGPMLAEAQTARGLAALASRQYERAYGLLRRVFDRADPVYHSFVRHRALGDLAEAAAGAGDRPIAEARSWLDVLEPVADATGSPVLLAGVAHARAFLAEDRLADEAFAAGLARDPRDAPLLHARLRLAHGMRLRGQRRVRESRSALRAAREAFTALEAHPWETWARRELRATGAARGRTGSAPRDALTPQEERIVRLAAEGLSNREIAGRLGLSHRTVSTHLYRLFPKLGVSARGQLGSALERRAAAGAKG